MATAPSPSRSAPPGAGTAAQGGIPAALRAPAGIVLALGNFMVVLDLTIANVSVPHIAGNLGISPDQGTWVITSYAVAEAICVPLSGWLAQRFGAVRMFLLSMMGFGLLSMLCGSSTTLGMLVVCRLGQGLCGGPIMPLSQTLTLRVFPPEQRTRAMAVWAMTVLLGPATGPILGGTISDNLSWHWIFFINLPVCAACVTSAFLLLRPIETPTVKLPIDGIGLALLIFWIGCLQVMLDIGRDRDWFGDPLVIVLTTGAAIGFAAFVIWELTEEHPVVDLRIFRHRGFSFGVVSLALCFGAYFSSIVVIPQWLQESLGYTAQMAGLVTAFTAMTALTTSQLVPRLLKRMDARILVSGAVAWIGLMSLWRAHWTSGADFWTLALPQVVQGFGMSFFVVPLTTLTLNAVPPEETASAAGLQSFLRTMAMAISTSIALTVWGDAQRVSQSELVGKIRPEQVQRLLGDSGFSIEQSRQVIANIVNQQAVVLAVDHTFTIAAIVLFVAAALIWCSPRARGPGDAPASGGH